MDIPNRLLRVLGMGVVVAFAIAGTACGSITDSADGVRQVGVIGPVADAQVVIPDTVRVGVEAVVEVTTFGSPCFRKGETEVEHAANTVKITPYDYPHARESCFSIEISFVHRATVEFSEPGLTSVVIVGRARATEDEVVEVAREVVVVEGQAPN